MGKLIFLDIDGTLTEPGTNVPPDSAVEAIEKARSNGHKLFLCTGRNPKMLEPLLKYDFDGFVGSSGGYVKVGEEVLFDRPIPKETLDLALELLHKNNVFCTIEGTDGAFGDTNIKDLLKDTEGGNSELIRWRKAITENLGIRPMTEYDGESIHKIVVMAEDASRLDECKAMIGKDYNFAIQDVPVHGLINGEIVSLEFDKGQAVKRICDYLGVPIDDTIGFGDSMNDLEMIETVAYSVVMDNGSPTLKEKADYICPSVLEDGIYEAFSHLGLI